MNINSYALITAVSALGFIILADVLPDFSIDAITNLFQNSLGLL